MTESAIKLIVSNCSPDEAPALARSLVDDRLAACVNVIGPIKSYYHWDGELCEDREVTLLIKTTAGRCDELIDELARLHSYDVPEIVVLDPEDVADSYAGWVHEQVR